MLNQINNIFIVGIKGVAMANLALILKKMGKKISGSDVGEIFITDELLKKNKIEWQVGFDNLPSEIDLVIYSAAHGGLNNPQVVEAKKKGIKIISQAEILGQIMQNFKRRIAVCGSHGKTTTASLLAYSLIKLEEKPSYLVGAPNFTNFCGADYQKSDYFVIEADEYGVNPPFDTTPKFNFLSPNYIVCTNIDFDHPDVYKNLEEVKSAFLKFFKKNLSSSILFLCADDYHTNKILNQLERKSYLTYGFSDKSDYQIVNWRTSETESEFEIKFRGNLREVKDKFRIKLYGEKNISNAAAVVACLLTLNFSAEKVKKAIENFTGAQRRFEKIYFGNSIFLFDDYAHHPKEIEATIKAARMRFPQNRILIIFQPHTYSRTFSLLSEFARALSYADKSFILPIFSSARERPGNFKISSQDIVRLSPSKLIYISTKKKLHQYLGSLLQPQDVIFTMGAGDVYKLKDDIIKIISNVKS